MGDRIQKHIYFDLMGKKYDFITDEPEEIVTKILETIKDNVEEIYSKMNNPDIVHVLLYLLLNENLEKLELKNGLKELINKASTVSHNKG
ncbi:hypothetical protein SAMN02745164_00006 [Marinitoga hydrogenitolerans DSM 16785]|uniref:Cell division protein ZapA n=1 Tax=Marinitoga hydrogenitolerans (strain DSM 16785 / JCM 12826 / AT1271) TaxID=1122195 RepID=A0A1M4S495_MARH1|nr:hypothetical protein [Marinitoga hydrogenitolerans]SHE27034.1 hypothetical protein SAMN02745164_00006 [Marinitoga hydrogenitolerans DSM 16785]